MPALAYDFSSPYAAASIVLPDGTVVPLWTNAAFSQGDFFLSSLAVVTEFVVEMQLAYLPKITLTLNLPLQDLIDFIDSDLIVWGQSYLQVQIGYIGGTASGPVLSPVFTGLLMKPDVTIGPDTSVTLVGYGQGGFDAVNSPGRAVSMRDTREKLMIALLAGPDKNNPRTIKLDRSQIVAGSDEDKALQVFDEISTGWQNDWFAVWRLARLCGCWIVQIAGNLTLVPRSGLATKTPKYEFAFFPGGAFGPAAQTNPQADQKTLLPILSISTNSFGALFLPKAASVTGQVLKGINSETGAPFVLPVDDASVNPARSGIAKNEPPANPEHPDGNQKSGDGVEPINSDQPTTLAMQIASSELTAIQSNNGIKLEIESIGVPDLFPGDLISVTGVGKRLSTGGEYVKNYSIFTVTHTYNASGLTTSFTAVSNVGQMFDKGKTTSGPVGTADADPSAAGEVVAQPTVGAGSTT